MAPRTGLCSCGQQAGPTFPVQKVDSHSQSIHKVAAGTRVPCCTVQVCEMRQGLLVGELHGLLHRDEGVLFAVPLCSHLLLQGVVGVCMTRIIYKYSKSFVTTCQLSTAVQLP